MSRLTQPRPHVRPLRSGARAFTLIELLVVIAIIGILAAILIPTVGGARNSAKKAETKVRFGQWATAMEQFKQEYGYYPKIDAATANRIDSDALAGALTGKAIDGVSAPVNTAGNSKLVTFYSISESDLDTGRTHLVDAFGNTDIAVLYDRNGDGVINASDGAIVSVTSASTGNVLTPSSDDLDLTAGVRAGVIFYSAGQGTNAGDIVYSWK